jgi:hypothetical protein
MLYIGGTAKSGTHHTTEFLNRLGIRVGHEYPSFDGMVSWYCYGAPNDYPNQYQFNQDECICLHQTREPAACISSIMSLNDSSWRYIRRWMQMDLSRPLLQRAMEYYYYWNRNLENCTFTYQVEQIQDLIEILDLFDVEYDRTKIDWALETPRLGQTANKNTLTWHDLFRQDYTLATAIAVRGQTYGYEFNYVESVG